MRPRIEPSSYPPSKAAKRWGTAVNNLKDFGEWEFLVCRDLDTLLTKLAELQGELPPPAAPRKEGELF